MYSPTPPRPFCPQRKNLFANCRRVIIKLGSAVLTRDKGLDRVNIHQISDQIAALVAMGITCIVVSSGAVAAGRKRLGMKTRPQTIPQKQAAAAVGQSRLMREWEEGLGKHDHNVAQVLLTAEDLADRGRYLNARHTLDTLLDWGVIPIINENDTVATDEIKFGDNDQLAALLAGLVQADLVILLTDTDGLYNKNPHLHDDAERLPLVESVDASLFELVGQSTSDVGTGGMRSKLMAAQTSTKSGIPLLIGPGRQRDVLLRLLHGESWGTLFQPHHKPYASKKMWLAHLSKPQGALVLDEGASNALQAKGSSLLPIGVVEVEGEFRAGDGVTCKTINGIPLGVGLSNYSASELRKIVGQRSDAIASILGYKHSDEVIHRDHFVLTTETSAEPSPND